MDEPYLYDWRLPDGTTLPIAHPDLARAQATVRELIEAPLRAALERPGGGCGGRALDLACNEGWWSHRLLEWGAGDVLAVEARPETVERARDLRARFGIDERRLEIVAGDATRVTPGDVGVFDVVLCLGLLYHLEDPIGMCRRLRALCAPGGLAVVEAQTARIDEPVAHAWGSSDEATETAAAGFALRWERDEHNRLASVGDVVSLIPNRAAVELSLRAAGFAQVEFATPQPHHMPGFLSGDRVVALASGR